MQIHIDPSKRSYVIIDPLNDDEGAKARIKQFLVATTGMRQNSVLKGADTQKGELDIHRMKTLCREILNLIDEGAVSVIKGATPDREDVDDLPGRYLLNPGLRTQTTQPVYEDQYDDWIERMSKAGI